MAITSLHNRVMPLIRYEVGDFAEVGPPCPCGRGLPVIARIMGRVRNCLRFPTKADRWQHRSALHHRPKIPCQQGAVHRWVIVAVKRTCAATLYVVGVCINRIGTV